MINVVFNKTAYFNKKFETQLNDNDLLYFNLMLSYGEITEEHIGKQRENILKRSLAIYPQYNFDDVLYELKYSINSLDNLIERMNKNEAVRIWYNQEADEICGVYWLINQFQRYKLYENIYIVSLPNSYHLKKSLQNISAHEWNNYLYLQEKMSKDMINKYSFYWKKLQKENTNLRILLNGQLISVSDDFYDYFITKEIMHQKSSFKVNKLINGILNKYNLGIHEFWLVERIDNMIKHNQLEIISQAMHDEPSFYRVLKIHN